MRLGCCRFVCTLGSGGVIVGGMVIGGGSGIRTGVVGTNLGSGAVDGRIGGTLLLICVGAGACIVGVDGCIGVGDTTGGNLILVGF